MVAPHPTRIRPWTSSCFGRGWSRLERITEKVASKTLLAEPVHSTGTRIGDSTSTDKIVFQSTLHMSSQTEQIIMLRGFVQSATDGPWSTSSLHQLSQRSNAGPEARRAVGHRHHVSSCR